MYIEVRKKYFTSNGMFAHNLNITGRVDMIKKMCASEEKFNIEFRNIVKLNTDGLTSKISMSDVIVNSSIIAAIYHIILLN